MNFIVPHYLDACVAVKLVAREDGYKELGEYIRANPSYFCWITRFAFYETLSVLKRKWTRKELDFHQYSSAISILDADLDTKELQIDGEFDFPDRALLGKARDFVEKYKIDYSDAIQLIAVLNGRWKKHAYECKTVFVSTDRDLVYAAKQEGIRTWHFLREPPPTST